MLDNVLSYYAVTPVKNEVGRLEAAPLLAVTPVLPVTPQKIVMQAESEKIAAPASGPETNPTITCKTCIHFESHYAHGGGSGICKADVMPFGACWWADDSHQCDKYLSSASEATAPVAPIDDPLLVEVWTPSGTPMMTRADNAEHVAWLKRMNPKPADPAPKPHGFEIDVDATTIQPIENEDSPHD